MNSYRSEQATGSLVKKEEWNRRIPLDVKGVRLLGAALYLRVCRRKSGASRAAEKRKNEAKPTNPFKEIDWLRRDTEHYERELNRWEKQHRDLAIRLKALNTSKNDYEKAKSLRANDFQYRWDTLRDHRLLVGFITNDQPLFAVNWDRETPICERWGDSLVEALTSIFYAEFERLMGPDPNDLPYLQDHEDFLFYLTVWKLCEPESGRGQPKGRRWPDGTANAVSHAYSLRDDAKRDGKPITTEEAIRRSLESFKVVSPDEFDNCPDKGSVVVSAAGIEGAIKSVRKGLFEADKFEESLKN